jgi:hypothetical protein
MTDCKQPTRASARIARLALGMGLDLPEVREAHKELLTRLADELPASRYFEVRTLPVAYSDDFGGVELRFSAGRSVTTMTLHFDGIHYTLGRGHTEVSLSIEWDGIRMVGADTDESIAPIPGERLPRRDAVDVIAAAFCKSVRERTAAVEAARERDRDARPST